MAKARAKAPDSVLGEQKHIMVDPLKVILGADNPRTIADKEADKNFRAHIASGGYIPPILVFRTEEDELQSIDGNRRLRIVRQLIEQGHPFEEGIAAILVDEPDPLKRLAMAMGANEGQPLNLLDRLNAYKRFAEAGWTGKEIAVQLSLSPGAISQGLDIVKYCGPDTLKALRDKKIDFMQAYSVAQGLKAKGAPSAISTTHTEPAPEPSEEVVEEEQALLEVAERERKETQEQADAMREATRRLSQQGKTMTTLEKTLSRLLTKRGPEGGPGALLAAGAKAMVLARELLPADAERGSKKRLDSIKGQINSLIDYYDKHLAQAEEAPDSR